MEIIPTHFRLSNKEIISGAIRIPDNPAIEDFEYYSSSRKIKLVFLQPEGSTLKIKPHSYISSDLSPFESELQKNLLTKLSEIGYIIERV
ncbi:hypothetical protein [Desertivirga brevis]|uniref:hypothetical protein n=1 Tax=Desertivirga brevis TaxID=2810310 RepID=UPI001A9584FE|nr:hypothetical protein [Pedobacter sp. SYSU D00873]